MATITVVSDTDEIYPLGFVRDVSNIPYVLAVDASDDLVLYVGNADDPSSFSSTTVATSGNWVKGASNAHMVIGVYSTIEYIWVFYKDGGNDLHAQRTPTSSISFSDQGDLVANIEGTIAAHYDDTNERIVIAFTPDSKAMSIVVTTNGGSSYGSEIEIWDGTEYCYGAGAVWDGDYIHCVVGRTSSRSAQFKRYNYSSSTLEYWNVSTWSTCSDTDIGYAPGIDGLGGNLLSSIGTNILPFSHGTYSDDGGSAYTRSSTKGESWTKFPNQGYNSTMNNRGSHTILTETGKVDDVIHFAGGSAHIYQDLCEQTYDYSGDSWGSVNTVEDYSAGYVKFIHSDPIQKNDWIGLAFGRFDGTSTYYVLYRHYQTGTGGVTDSEDMKSASTRIKRVNESVKSASTRIKIPTEDVKSASTRIAYVSEDIKLASTNVAYTSEDIKSASTRVSQQAIDSEDIKSASTRIKLISEDIKSASTRVALIAEDVKSASTQVALTSEDIKSASTRVKANSEDIKSASTQVALVSEDIKSASTRVKRISEDIKSASTRIAFINEDTKDVSTRVALINEDVKSASTRVQPSALYSEDIKIASTRVKANSEDVKSASTQIKRISEDIKFASTQVCYTSQDIKLASTRIAFTSEDIKSASTQVALISEDIKSVSTRIALISESIKSASTQIAFISESVKSASTQIKRLNESIKDASTRIALSSEDIKSASTRIVLVSESIKSASTRITLGALSGESIVSAITHITIPDTLPTVLYVNLTETLNIDVQLENSEDIHTALTETINIDVRI